MKKIMKIIYICLFMFILIPNIVSASTLKVVNQGNIYSNRLSNGITYYGQLGYIYIDNKLSFCVEPLNIIGNVYNYDESVLNNIDDNTLDYIKLIGNFNITNVYYYMAAQELIWEALEDVEVYYTSKNYTAGNVFNIDSYKNEIIDYVNKAYLTPNFGDINFSADIGETIELVDSNNVLNEYTVINNTSNVIWKDNNKLYIKVVDNNSFGFQLGRAEIDDEASGYSGNGQDLAHLSNTYILEKKYTVSVTSYKTKINIERYVSDVRAEGVTTFKIYNVNTSQFVVYNNTDVFSSDEQGNFYSEFELNEGAYQIINQEIPGCFIYGETTEFEIKKEDYNGNEYYKINDYLNKPIGIIKIKTYIETKDGFVRSNKINAYIYAEEDIYDIRGFLAYKKGDLVAISSSEIGSMDTYILLGDYRIEFRDSNDILFNKDIYYVSLDYIDSYTQYSIYVMDVNIKFNGSVIDIETTFEGDKQDNVNYELYAKEDIYVDDILIYSKDELISSYESNEEGKIYALQYMPYGNYYLKSANDFELYKNVDNIDINFNIDNSLFDIDVFMELKNKIIEEVKEDIVEESDKVEENVITNNNENITESNKENIVNMKQEVLPNTSNYKLKYYLVFIFIILINVFILVKYENK